MFSKPLTALCLIQSASAVRLTTASYGAQAVTFTTHLPGYTLLGYEDALHMDAFSLDHHDTTNYAALKINPSPSAKSFGFGEEGFHTFANSYTSVDAELSRLHKEFDEDAPATDSSNEELKRPVSLFDALKTTEKKKTPVSVTSGIDAPVAQAENKAPLLQEITSGVVVGKDSLNIGGSNTNTLSNDSNHGALPQIQEDKTLAESNKLRMALGLEQIKTTIPEIPKAQDALAYQLAAAREDAKNMFLKDVGMPSSDTTATNSFLSAVPGLPDASSILATTPSPVVFETEKADILLDKPRSVAEVLNLSAASSTTMTDFEAKLNGLSGMRAQIHQGMADIHFPLIPISTPAGSSSGSGNTSCSTTTSAGGTTTSVISPGSCSVTSSVTSSSNPSLAQQKQKMKALSKRK